MKLRSDICGLIQWRSDRSRYKSEQIPLALRPQSGSPLQYLFACNIISLMRHLQVVPRRDRLVVLVNAANDWLVNSYWLENTSQGGALGPPATEQRSDE